MKSATGRWVSGGDFFDRESELQVLFTRVCEGNHTLLAGHRGMGKTSVLHELGQRMTKYGWVSLYVDVQDAKGPEDVIAGIAKAMHFALPLASRRGAGADSAHSA